MDFNSLYKTSEMTLRLQDINLKLQNLPGSIHENSFFRSIDTLSSPFFKTALYSGYGLYKLIKFKTDSFKNKIDLLNENFKMIEEQIESYQINF